MTKLAPGANAGLGQGPWMLEARPRRTAKTSGVVVDFALYLLRADGRVAGDEGMIFYGQTTTPDGSVRFEWETDATRFGISRVPSGIDRMAVTAVGENDADLGRVGWIDVTVRRGKDIVAEFAMETTGRSEKAFILAEIYLRNGETKIRSVCQGFNGGLRRLSEHYGVEVEDDAQPAPTLTPAPVPVRSTPTPAVRPQTAPPAPVQSRVSIKKVSLDKNATVSLAKGGGAIRATLRWQGRANGAGDLDFYCYLVDRDGRQSKVYWKDLGRSDRHPYVEHQGDSRRAGEETIVIHRPDTLRFALFAAYSAVKNGAGSFASYRPEVILTDERGNEVTIPLLNDNHTSYWVAISHIEFGDETRIRHVETYGASGLRFIAAEKSPRLHPDGTWDVSKGDLEFKR